MKASALAHFRRVHRQRGLAGPGLHRFQPDPRRTLINVAARVSTSARRITLHLPENWPWEHGWTALFTVSDFARNVRDRPGQTEHDYTIRQAAYDLVFSNTLWLGAS